MTSQNPVNAGFFPGGVQREKKNAFRAPVNPPISSEKRQPYLRKPVSAYNRDILDLVKSQCKVKNTLH